jgi:N-acetylglutamate synthase-like GNAT family acetyltransferase
MAQTVNAPATKIERAAAADLDGLLSLLDSVNLPREGVAEHLSGFLVARDAAGRIAGCVGMERHGEIALLRSAAVAPDSQGAGLGRRLTAALLEHARAEGVAEVVLLTTTARNFFADKFGFREAARADYEARLARSPEWNLPRCSSAVLMRLPLGPE